MKTRSSAPSTPLKVSSSSSVDYSLFGGAEILPPSLSNLSTSSSSNSDSSSDSEESISYEKTGEARAGEAWLPQKVNQDRSDFLWMMNEEPHRSRRRAILKAHPEVCLVLYSFCFFFVSRR